jgi:hypothetical protein
MVARGRVIRPGRTVTVCAGDVVAVDGQTETPVATILATMRVAGDRSASRPEATTRAQQILVHPRGRRRWCLCRAWTKHRPDVAASA